MKHHVPAAKVPAGRFTRTVFPCLAILVIGIAALLGILVYRISNPGAVAESVTPSHYLLSFLELGFPSGKGPEIPAWWIPGLKNAPGIILAPGHGMNRTDALSLAVALNQKGFNLLIYAQRGSGNNPRGASTLGLQETEDMASAVGFLRNRSESDPNRLGIWGVDISAFAALKTAAEFREILAIAVDSPYETIRDYLDYRIAEDIGLHNNLLQIGCFQAFRIANIFRRGSLNDPLPLQVLSGKAILFIKGEDRAAPANMTMAVYEKIQPQKELLSLAAARSHAMSGEMLKTYDGQVASFFHNNLK